MAHDCCPCAATAAEERDRARSLAAALEAELAEIRAVLDRASSGEADDA